jgi:hypothetical protein
MKHWTDQLPRPKLSYNDGRPSEGTHGPEAHALAYDTPGRWPIYIQEAGYAVWTAGDFWRRIRSERLAVEIVTAGEMYLQQDGRDYLVGPGQAMILRRRSSHVYATGPGGSAHKRFVTLVGPALEAMLSASGLDRLDVVELGDGAGVARAMRDAYRLLDGKPAGYEKRISALAYAIVNELIASSSTRRSELVQKAIDFMQRNPHLAASNGQLARVAGVTSLLWRNGCCRPRPPRSRRSRHVPALTTRSTSRGCSAGRWVCRPGNSGVSASTSQPARTLRRSPSRRARLRCR